MKKLLLTISLIGLLSFTVYYCFFLGPSHFCEQIIEPHIPEKEFTNVDNFVKYTVKEHMQILQGPENIQTAINNYKLNELYDKEANTLQEEIASNLKVTQISDSNKISIKVYANSEKKAQQIGYALVTSYISILRQKKQERNKEITRRFDLQIDFQQRKVFKAKRTITELAKQYGIPYEDPSSNKIYRNSLKHPTDQLSPEQKTQYAIIEDIYKSEMTSLQTITEQVFQKTISSGSMDPIMYHNYAFSDETSLFMNNRRASSKE